MVLTSGNVSDEPIAYADEERRAAFVHRGRFLIHDRQISLRTDDSVVRFREGGNFRIAVRAATRRTDRLPFQSEGPILACGAELKNTFCLAKRRHAFVSHHIGDLENFETLRAFRDGIDHFRRLFDINSRVVAFDLHPEYLSTKYALELNGVDFVGVQHHHAHVAACLADNGEHGPAIGVAFDGLALDSMGLCGAASFWLRILRPSSASVISKPVPMPGGTAAINSRGAWRRHTWASVPETNFRSISRSWSELEPMAADHCAHRAPRHFSAHFQRGPLVRRCGGDPFGARRDHLRRPGGGRTRAAHGGRRSGAYAGSCPRPRFHSSFMARHLCSSVVNGSTAGTSVDARRARFHNSIAMTIVKAASATHRARLSLVAPAAEYFKTSCCWD